VSIGYERRSLNELIEILLRYKVVKLLDIRELPLSRRKGFNKNELTSRLEEAGIKYRHIRSAGNPHRKKNGDVGHCLRLYASYLGAHPEVLDLVAKELSKVPVALLCYERHHYSCHRSVLVDALCNRGHRLEVVKVE
jgi:uncharacterized protein (DUF488 family)